MPAHRLSVGNVEITVLADARARAPWRALFPSHTPEQWARFAEYLIDNGENMDMTIPSFIVRSMGKTLLIDSGIGDKDRRFFPKGRLPDAMAEEGIKPGDIDIVFSTHMHIDHVGWHTTIQGDGFVPTFPEARHVFVRKEWEHFTSEPQVSLPANQHIRDCVLPIRDKVAIDLVDGEHKLTDELVLLPTPGHTPAHSSVAIMSGGEAAVLIGDVCHHPAQMIETSWSPIFDANPALSAQSREMLMQKIEAERLLVLAGHFAYPGVGRLVQVEGRRSWRAM